MAIAERGSAPAVLELPDQEPGSGQVRVAVEAASVNGFDVAVAAGYVWDVLPHEFPVVLGRDVAGTVDSVGDGVSDVQIGDRVTAVVTGVGLGPVGTFGDRFTAGASTVARVPDGVTAAQAAAVGLAGATALDAVNALEVGDGDLVLVSGATGGVGSFAVQLAVARGARVIATARPGEGEDLVRQLGAAQAVDFTGDLPAAVRAIAPDGVDKVVHAAGDPAVLAGLLVPGGRLLSVLGADAGKVGRDDVTVVSLVAEPAAEKLTELLSQVADGSLIVAVSGSYPLENAAAALAAFAAGKLGKIVVTVP
jgi:NADPH:quinone reductase-like Zn-dependent oxidoreductase